MTKIVIGLDVSLTSTGIAWFTSDGQAGWANPKTRAGDKSLVARHERLSGQVESIRAALPAYCREGCYCGRPELSCAAIETPSFGSQGGMSHERGYLWWAVAGLFIGDYLPIAGVSPKQRAKYGCGNGNGDKKAVREGVRATYGHLFEKGIPNDDVADAVALAALGARLSGWPVEAETLTYHTTVAEAVIW